MKVTLAYQSSVLLAAGALLLLQTSSSEAVQPTKPAASDVMKLSGCLRSSAAGDSKTTPQPVVYTLDVAAAHDQKGAAAPSGAPAERAEAKSRAPLKPAAYSITAPASVGLAAHVNHRVELTGRMIEGTATTTGTPGPPSPETAEAVDPTAAASNRTFEVQSLRMISATCPVPKAELDTESYF